MSWTEGVGGELCYVVIQVKWNRKWAQWRIWTTQKADTVNQFIILLITRLIKKFDVNAHTTNIIFRKNITLVYGSVNKKINNYTDIPRTYNIVMLTSQPVWWVFDVSTAIDIIIIIIICMYMARLIITYTGRFYKNTHSLFFLVLEIFWNLIFGILNVCHSFIRNFRFIRPYI